MGPPIPTSMSPPTHALSRIMIWKKPNSIDSFATLADTFVKAHARAIKVATRKSDLFKVRQRDNEILKEFVSRFQMECMELPPVTDDWSIQAFTQGLNERSTIASRQLKQNLIEYSAITWVDVHNRYQSKIRVEDDQLGAPSSSVHPNRSAAKNQRDINKEPRSNKDRYYRTPHIAGTVIRDAIPPGTIGEAIEEKILGDS
ncbi:uncharacterized protein [Nicotiana sylvestris]|uniref:uncharacterized protein n=1 Tax=Nicotiana sylvestris TaxID=4096 RepID=UPI00388CB33F